MLLLAGLLGALAAGSFVAISAGGRDDDDDLEAWSEGDPNEVEDSGGAGDTSLLDRLGILDFMDRAGADGDEAASGGDQSDESWPDEARDAAWSDTGAG